MTPASPWMGSTRNATVFFVMAFSRALASPKGIALNPGVNGPNPSLYCSSVSLNNERYYGFFVGGNEIGNASLLDYRKLFG